MNKEQQIKEIIESVQKAADEALQKIKELEKEETNYWPWQPRLNGKYYALNMNGLINAHIYFKESNKEWFLAGYNRGLIAPATEEGRKTLEKRDEWFRFIFKFMTAGDVSANGTGHCLHIYGSKSIGCEYDNKPSTLGQKKFSTKDKFNNFVKLFCDGDYIGGLEYIRKMLMGGLE